MTSSQPLYKKEKDGKFYIAISTDEDIIEIPVSKKHYDALFS